jgi:acyl-CoA thioester hydrolase
MPAIPLDRAAATTVSSLLVRFCDTDLMGIVHHANYFAYFEAGRVAWLKRRGVTYGTWASGGHHLPVVDATVKYRAPARFDDVLDIETTLADLRFASLRFDYRIHRGGELLTEGSTRLACVDAQHQVRRFTDEMLRVLQMPELSLDGGASE